MEIEKVIEELDLCACVDDEYVEDIVLILKELAREEFVYITDLYDRTTFSHKYILSILCWLDNLGFIEHGSSIWGSWPTNEGIEFLKRTGD